MLLPHIPQQLILDPEKPEEAEETIQAVEAVVAGDGSQQAQHPQKTEIAEIPHFSLPYLVYCARVTLQRPTTRPNIIISAVPSGRRPQAVT